MLLQAVQDVLALEGQVGLEAEDDGAALESLELADRRYVVEHAAMRSTDILGAQSFGAEHLRHWEWNVGVWGCGLCCSGRR